jgi:hypothetical protein
MAFVCRTNFSLQRLRSLTFARSAYALKNNAFASVRFQTTSTSTASEEQVRSFNEIPGSGTLKALISFFVKDGMSTMHLKQQEARKEYGPIYREILGPYKTVFVFDPDVVQQVFRNEGKYPTREPDLPMWSKYKKDRGQSEGVLSL